MLYHVGDSRHTQNLQINKVIAENEKCVMYFTEKTEQTFWSTQYQTRGWGRPLGKTCLFTFFSFSLPTKGCSFPPSRHPRTCIQGGPSHLRVFWPVLGRSGWGRVTFPLLFSQTPSDSVCQNARFGGSMSWSPSVIYKNNYTFGLHPCSWHRALKFL